MTEADASEHPMKCPYCGKSTYADIGRLTLTVNDRLVLIDDVPALVCKGCMEQFFGEEILSKVERLRGDGLTFAKPREVIEVPVYSWEELK